MKVRVKATEEAEATKVRFGTAALPDFLKGKLVFKDGKDGDGTTIEDGDYLVKQGEDVQHVKAADFDAKFDRVRKKRSDSKS